MKFNVLKGMGFSTVIEFDDNGKRMFSYQLDSKDDLDFFWELSDESKLEILSTKNSSFINFKSNNIPSKDFKFTVVGKTLEDSLYLLNRLGKFLYNSGFSFKVGTKKLIDAKDSEQSYKLLTIYLPQNSNPELLYSDLKSLLKSYTGYKGINLKYSVHLDGAIYYRVDKDLYGNYIPAKTKSELIIDMFN